MSRILHLAPHQPDIKKKEQYREELNADLAAFQARGGKIEVIDYPTALRTGLSNIDQSASKRKKGKGAEPSAR